MPRRRSLTSQLYSLARTSNNLARSAKDRAPTRSASCAGRSTASRWEQRGSSSHVRAPESKGPSRSSCATNPEFGFACGRDART
jgi:hypothetical protein